jgi:carbamoyltransferase
MKVTWGISANSHDAALSVYIEDHPLDDNGWVFGSHSERFSGIKNDPNLDTTLINYALRFGEPNEIVWYENPLKKTLRQLWAGQGLKLRENNISRYLSDTHSVFNNKKIHYVDHHHAHAAAGYYTSGFSDACVLVIDSIGEWDTISVWNGSWDHLTKKSRQSYPNSIGLWYSAMTQRVGLKPQEDEYILMGMAAYGDPTRLYKDICNDFIKQFPTFEDPVVFTRNLHRGCKDWRPDLTTEQDMFDIAAATQRLYENLFEYILQSASSTVESQNLVLMGGCALNCSANGIAQKYFKNVWIMPNPGDAGSSLGAILAHKSKHITWPGPYRGYDIKGEYPVEKIIQELLENGICGVANGRAEFGPRALGNRSLLADPRGNDIKHRVNAIKQRQQFRPFAPAILAEHAGDYFEGSTGPYMQFTARCRFPELYPAIVHADGTSRVQTVGSKDNPGFRRLLERWYKETGCPMLLNTSLNIKGQPMVNDLFDAKGFSMYYGIKVY